MLELGSQPFAPLLSHPLSHMQLLSEITTSKAHPLSRKVPQLLPFLGADQPKFAELRNAAWGSQAFDLNAIMGFLLESLSA